MIRSGRRPGIVAMTLIIETSPSGVFGTNICWRGSMPIFRSSATMYWRQVLRAAEPEGRGPKDTCFVSAPRRALHRTGRSRRCGLRSDRRRVDDGDERGQRHEHLDAPGHRLSSGT